MLVTSLIAYLLILIIVSRLLSPRMTTLSEFFLASRQLPTVAIALTFVASWFGAGSTIGSMGQAYTEGVSSLWLIAVPSLLTCLIVGAFFARRVWAFPSLSLPEVIEAQYGPWGALLLSMTILATSTTLIASQLVAAEAMLSTTMGLTPEWSVGMILAAIVLYSVIGGFRAVVMTDILQFICFTLAVIILFGAVWMLPVNPHPADVPTGFWNPFHHLGASLATVFTFTLAWSIAPEMWQRMSASRDGGSAQKAVLAAGIILMLLYAIVISTGVMAKSHLPPEGFDNRNVLISLAMHLPHPALTAMVLVGVLSALTSTIDSSLNVSSLTMTRNIIHRYFQPSASPEAMVRTSRLVTIFICVPAAIISLRYQDIIQILWISADLYASTMFIPVMGVFYCRNSGKLAGVLAMILGAVPVVLNFCKDFHWILLPTWWPAWPFTTLLGISLSLTGFCVGLAFRRGPVTAPEPEPEPVALESVS